MSAQNLSVREIRETDIDYLVKYWFDSDPVFLTGMGVDIAKMPGEQEWRTMLKEQLGQPYEEKKSYCIIWLADEEPVGHSNINRIIFGEEAYMHLHLWSGAERKKGYGTQFVKMTLPFFFEKYRLKRLCCEPYALNPAPNHTLKKAGFEFIKEYITVPGWINFEQPVCHWEMSYGRFKSLT